MPSMSLKEYLAGRTAVTIADADELYVRDADADDSKRITWASIKTALASVFTNDDTVDAHIADAVDAHDASAVSIGDAGGYYTGTDTEAALQEVGADIAALPSQYAPLGRTVFTQRPYEVINDGIYTAWPNGCLFVDEANELICQAYTNGDSHVDSGSNNKIAYFRSQGFNDIEPGAAVVISDVTGSTLDSTVHGCGIAANGDYLATVRHANGGGVVAMKLYRSTNQGATWDSGTQMVDTTATDILSAEASHLFLTASGSLLVGLSDGIGRNTTADGSGQWTVVDVDANGTSEATLEGQFAQLNNGTIICLLRENVRAAPYTERQAVFIKSTDDGATWSPAEWVNVSMSANPCAMIHHADSDQVEVLVGDRYPLNGDGFGSIWHYITTGANAALGVFGNPTRIMVGYPSKDFGYPAAVHLPDDRVLLRWYDDENGLGTNTAIYEMWGERPTGS